MYLLNRVPKNAARMKAKKQQQSLEQRSVIENSIVPIHATTPGAWNLKRPPCDENVLPHPPEADCQCSAADEKAGDGQQTAGEPTCDVTHTPDEVWSSESAEVSQ